jgi:hypothetical protein
VRAEPPARGETDGAADQARADDGDVQAADARAWRKDRFPAIIATCSTLRA